MRSYLLAACLLIPAIARSELVIIEHIREHDYRVKPMSISVSKSRPNKKVFIPKNLGVLIDNTARRHGVPVQIVKAVVSAESGGNAKAVSNKGAEGVMQLMPATQDRFGVDNPFDPAQNVNAGVKYLKWLLDRFHGNVKLAVAGYNAGEGNVDKYKGVPPFSETRRYVEKVLSRI
jgi:soluble lytic murein transglycosylase-like protein